MRRLKWIIIAGTVAQLGCKGLAKSPIAGLSPQDYNTVQSVNDAQAITIQAAQGSASGIRHFVIDPGKLTKTAAALDNSGCKQTILAPQGFDHSWQGEWDLDNSDNTCPIYLRQHESFEHASGTWTRSRVVAVRDPELRSLNGLDSLNQSGSFTVHTVNEQKILSGTVKYTSLQMEVIGAVNATITFNQTSFQGTSSGSVNLSLAAGATQVNASITFTDSAEAAQFKVNGQETDPDAFEGVFSSFELTEIMDRALDMR
jgi:hypothetical protein